jgi:putative DNA-invertase from lambdoid prophage Rac
MCQGGKEIVVTKLDRLGRNTTDVLGTVDKLAGMGVHVHCLALKEVDLTCGSGEPHMTVLAAVSQFERACSLSERIRDTPERRLKARSWA